MNPVTFVQLTGLSIFCSYDNKPWAKFVIRNFEPIVDKIPDIRIPSITLNGRVLPSGTILQRPLKYLAFPDEFLHHEGVVIGTADNNRVIILEMNDKPRNGVNIVDTRGFLDMYDSSYLIVRSVPSEPIPVSLLLERTKVYDREPYNISELNCVDFAHWLVYGKKKLSFKEKQLEQCGELLNLLKLIITATPPPTKESVQKEFEKFEKRKAELKSELDQFYKEN